MKTTRKPVQLKEPFYRIHSWLSWIWIHLLSRVLKYMTCKIFESSLLYSELSDVISFYRKPQLPSLITTVVQTLSWNTSRTRSVLEWNYGRHNKSSVYATDGSRKWNVLPVNWDFFDAALAFFWKSLAKLLLRIAYRPFVALRIPLLKLRRIALIQSVLRGREAKRWQ